MPTDRELALAYYYDEAKSLMDRARKETDFNAEDRQCFATIEDLLSDLTGQLCDAASERLSNLAAEDAVAKTRPLRESDYSVLPLRMANLASAE